MEKLEEAAANRGEMDDMSGSDDGSSRHGSHSGSGGEGSSSHNKSKGGSGMKSSARSGDDSDQMDEESESEVDDD